jgi:hypothetical protein
MLLLALRFHDICPEGNEIYPIPKGVTSFSELVNPNVYEFVDSLGDQVYELFMFSDYIDFVQLRNVLGMKIAFDIRQCKTVEEIRTLYGLENDFDPTEFAVLLDESNCLQYKVTV